MTSGSSGQRHFFACDLCGAERTIHCDSFTDAWGSLKEDGWETFRDEGDWKHTCPDCGD